MPRPPAVAIGELRANGSQNVVAGADCLADDQIACILQRLPDLLAAGNLADAEMSGIIGEDDDVAGKEWPVRAAQIEQHAVAPGDRDHLHCSNYRRAGETGAYSVLNHVILPRQARLGLRSSLATDVHCAAKSLRQLAKETGDHLCPKLVSRLAGLKLETHHPVIEPVSTRAGNGNF